LVALIISGLNPTQLFYNIYVLIISVLSVIGGCTSTQNVITNTANAPTALEYRRSANKVTRAIKTTGLSAENSSSRNTTPLSAGSSPLIYNSEQNDLADKTLFTLPPSIEKVTEMIEKVTEVYCRDRFVSKCTAYYTGKMAM
jgi:hypothetical protein